MIDELIDQIDSLTLIMVEETAQLLTPVRIVGHAGIADAKLRLVAMLETRVAQVAREGGDWLDGFDTFQRAALLDALARLRDAAEPNARMLARQIDLSSELMSVVAAEAQRLTGRRSATYGAMGALSVAELAAPISVNTSL